MTERQHQIVITWMTIETDEPDISTEMLLHKVETCCRCEAGEVCEALDAYQKEEAAV